MHSLTCLSGTPGFLSPRLVSCSLDFYRVSGAEVYIPVVSTGGVCCHCKNGRALLEAHTVSFLPALSLLWLSKGRSSRSFEPEWPALQFLWLHASPRLTELLHPLLQRPQLLCVPSLVVSIASYLSEHTWLSWDLSSLTYEERVSPFHWVKHQIFLFCSRPVQEVKWEHTNFLKSLCVCVWGAIPFVLCGLVHVFLPQILKWQFFPQVFFLKSLRPQE